MPRSRRCSIGFIPNGTRRSAPRRTWRRPLPSWSTPPPSSQPCAPSWSRWPKLLCCQGRRLLVGIGPFTATAEPRIEEQDRQLQQQQLGMDQAVDGLLPPVGLAPAVFAQPPV